MRGSDDDYKHRTPEPADVALLVEVSESTLDRDQGEKLLAYGQGRHRRLLDRQPGRRPGRGLQRTEAGGLPIPSSFQSWRRAVPVVIDGKEVGRIAVADILP